MTHPRSWTDWPACPGCGRPRQTACPTCGAAGNQFLLAEYLTTSDPLGGCRERPAPGETAVGDVSAVLLLCPQCDEAFGPRFYRHCPACGYDAGDGIEVQHGTARPVSNRVLLVLYGLIALGLLLILYFSFLFRAD